MVRKRIEWTKDAQLQLNDILRYWNEVTFSNKYSKKLKRLFKEEVKLIAKYPNSGVQSKLNIRWRVVENYLMFYEITDKGITILKIWDGRRNPELLVY